MKAKLNYFENWFEHYLYIQKVSKLKKSEIVNLFVWQSKIL
jgi:hypothetical protein